MGRGDQERECHDRRATQVLPQPKQTGVHREETYRSRPADVRGGLVLHRERERARDYRTISLSRVLTVDRKGVARSHIAGGIKYIVPLL